MYMNSEPLIILQPLSGNMPTSLHPAQEMLLPYIDQLRLAWWAVFVITLATVAYHGFRHYRASTTE